MRAGLLVLAAVAALGDVAAAEPVVTVAPRDARPGDAVLVTVTGVDAPPDGKLGGAPLRFFAATAGFQALGAIPLDFELGTIEVHVAGARPRSVPVTPPKLRETSLVVEDELASPPKEERERIAADNRAILEAAEAPGAPQFTRPFRRPPGKVTSPFGTWRIFNDGHRSQHLGLDYTATERSRVRALNRGTVTLVRDCFLAGNVVVVAHGAGIATAYYHLAEAAVKEGDVVERGAVVGLAGHTGRATGPHLHLSVRVPGGFVDPARFLALKLRPAPES
jgi:murein DD-endopeptidase MepM/ murein hydrolase activator NlpD